MMVKTLLGQYEYLESRRYAGDLVAVDTLLDLQSAIVQAKLNERQSSFIHLYYVQGYTGDEIGAMHGTSRGNVNNILRRAENRIQTIYDGWIN